MALRIRHLIIFFLSVFFVWFGWATYTYFFDIQEPHLQIVGLEQGQWCAGDVQCSLLSSKKGEISLLLDGKPLVTKFNMVYRQEDHPFILPTKTIANGAHELVVECVDTTYHKNRICLKRSFFVDNIPLQAALVRTDATQKVLQGRTLHVQFQANKEVDHAFASVLSNKYECFPESKGSFIYECYVPISCEEQPNEYLATVDLVDKVGNSLCLDNRFQVIAFPFKKEFLHISAEKVKEEEALGNDSALFENEIKEIVDQSPREKLWRGSFCTPIDIARITCDFGTIRTTQHRGRYAHRAVDVINMPKSVVWAPQDGIVVMKKRFALSGNSVIIDHGWGIISLFFHLEDFAPSINVGDTITKGRPLGYLGKTGYASGYHLHWEMRINNVPVDPMQWTKTTF
ncbi:MAG: M23 family metallopeptidase [Candidatus Dependentiae bacterium]|nr:M23 family metallopeptidase [Candidatus Dependentiae bacterium]